MRVTAFGFDGFSEPKKGKLEMQTETLSKINKRIEAAKAELQSAQPTASEAGRREKTAKAELGNLAEEKAAIDEKFNNWRGRRKRAARRHYDSVVDKKSAQKRAEEIKDEIDELGISYCKAKSPQPA